MLTCSICRRDGWKLFIIWGGLGKISGRSEIGSPIPAKPPRKLDKTTNLFTSEENDSLFNMLKNDVLAITRAQKNKMDTKALLEVPKPYIE